MAKKAKPGDRVTNLTETKDIIRNAVPRIVTVIDLFHQRRRSHGAAAP